MGRELDDRENNEFVLEVEKFLSDQYENTHSKPLKSEENEKLSIKLLPEIISPYVKQNNLSEKNKNIIISNFFILTLGISILGINKYLNGFDAHLITINSQVNLLGIYLFAITSTLAFYQNIYLSIIYAKLDPITLEQPDLKIDIMDDPKVAFILSLSALALVAVA